MKLKFVLISSCVLLAGSGFIAPSATAQTKAYRQTNLASSVPGGAANEAQTLNNPWAIAFLPDRPFFIVDSSAGSIISLNSSGIQANAVAVAIPPVEIRRSMPSGIASDRSGVFGLANAPFHYLVVRKWNDRRILNTQRSGSLTSDACSRRLCLWRGLHGLALLQPLPARRFAVANFRRVDYTFTSTFDLLDRPGAFQDPHLPAGYAP